MVAVWVGLSDSDLLQIKLPNSPRSFKCFLLSRKITYVIIRPSCSASRRVVAPSLRDRSTWRSRGMSGSTFLGSKCRSNYLRILQSPICTWSIYRLPPPCFELSYSYCMTCLSCDASPRIGIWHRGQGLLFISCLGLACLRAGRPAPCPCS